MAVSWIALAAFAASALGATIAPERQVLEQSSCGRVWVTVHSPDISVGWFGVLLDAIELNWNFTGCSHIPRQIGLFDDRPTTWDKAMLVYPINSEDGYVVTNVSLGEGRLPGGWDAGPGRKGPHCLWPWTAAGDDQIDSFNCLKIQPTWMEDNAEKINHLRVVELAIPGTHNSGAWRFDTDLRSICRDRFFLCQDRSIWAQLVHGIRYFDFRVAYYDYENEDDRYWLNHDKMMIRPLLPLLKEIRTFLDHTREVVILDFHRFPVGFNNEDVHEGLLRLVQRELGPHLDLDRKYLTSDIPTVQSLLKSDKRLLVTYENNFMISEYKWLWPGVKQLWADTNDPTGLFRNLDNMVLDSEYPVSKRWLQSVMAQTTPGAYDLLFKAPLRKYADDVNRNVTARLATRWRQQANIVATDFFLGNDVIDVSIMISVERGSKLGQSQPPLTRALNVIPLSKIADIANTKHVVYNRRFRVRVPNTTEEAQVVPK